VRESDFITERLMHDQDARLGKVMSTLISAGFIQDDQIIGHRLADKAVGIINGNQIDGTSQRCRHRQLCINQVEQGNRFAKAHC